jgi:hypothetical protein
MKTTTLYRPVGEKEMILIMESGFKKFPPRLEWQPIFYPVLTKNMLQRLLKNGIRETKRELSWFCYPV